MILFPILRWLDVKALKANPLLGIRSQDLYFRVRRREPLGFDPERNRILPVRLQLQDLRKPANMVLILPYLLHPQRNLPAMRYLAIGESRYTLIILEPPRFEMIPVYIFKIAIQHASWIVLLERCPAVMHLKKRIRHQHALGIVAVLWVSHDDSNQIQPMLSRRLLQFSRFG